MSKDYKITYWGKGSVNRPVHIERNKKACFDALRDLFNEGHIHFAIDVVPRNNNA